MAAKALQVSCKLYFVSYELICREYSRRSAVTITARSTMGLTIHHGILLVQLLAKLKANYLDGRLFPLTNKAALTPANDQQDFTFFWAVHLDFNFTAYFSNQIEFNFFSARQAVDWSLDDVIGVQPGELLSFSGGFIQKSLWAAVWGTYER